MAVPRSDVRIDTEEEQPRTVTVEVLKAPGDAARRIDGAWVDGLSESLQAALLAPPVWEKQVLELALSRPDLTDAEARMAAVLRVFLLTWDPLEWNADRGTAFATTTRRPDGFGLVVYLPHWHARELGVDDPDGLAGVLGRFSESVLAVAAENEAAIEAGDYAGRVHAGELPPLLSRVADHSSRATPAVELVGDGWQKVQFDVIEDLAQDAFGPADLDRSPVVFQLAATHHPGCPGCDGRSVDFPDGLRDAQTTICSVHRGEALEVITARLDAAKESNPSGWEALLDAGRRLDQGHLPNGLGPQLLAAARATEPTPDELGKQAALVLETAGLAAERWNPLKALTDDNAVVRPWIEALPATLVAAGLTAESEAVAAAAARLLAAGPESNTTDAEAPPLAPPKPEPIRRGPRIGRNAPCPCGSGTKYKYCHGGGQS